MRKDAGLSGAGASHLSRQDCLVADSSSLPEEDIRRNAYSHTATDTKPHSRRTRLFEIRYRSPLVDAMARLAEGHAVRERLGRRARHRAHDRQCPAGASTGARRFIRMLSPDGRGEPVRRAGDRIVSAAPPVFADVVIPPTAERWRRGDIRRADKQVQDARGEIGDPFITIATLARMHAAGKISTDMARAGNRFHGDFVRAHLSISARASDFLRPPIGTMSKHGDHSTWTYICRERVWNALLACGGPNSPCGSCAWHIVGLEESVKTWCMHRYIGARITENAAAGVLTATLGCLEGYYRNGGR
jgi:hypothetical protein